jgi:hypothetical protein
MRAGIRAAETKETRISDPVREWQAGEPAKLPD